jgi:hypothetical protein
MSDKTFHAQSTKETYRFDIEDSYKQKTLYKNYEYFDDYSYSNSKEIGFLIKTIKNKNYLYLFQSDGPKNTEQLRKLFEWRRSGDSDEIGHKGGGNKRNIYGFKSKCTTIFSKINNDCTLFCETKPNDIYDLSISDINEQEFRSKVDTSKYITVPLEKDPEELPSWYQIIFDDIKQESNIDPNYLIRMELTEIPPEYNNQPKWDEYINQIRSKQYNIPIYFKNELLNHESYKKYDNIDLVGFHNKESEKNVNLFIDKTDLLFYIKDDNKYINVNTKITTINTQNMILWGTINMFIINKKYLTKQLEIYNDNLDDKLKQEDIYGVYLKINGKLTNYLPIDGFHLPPSKNNGIKSGNQNNTSRFRFVIEPNNDKCNNKYFNELIRTETIKALSGFLDKSPYKKIIKQSMNIYKGITNKIHSIPAPKPKQTDPTINTGCVYIIYIGSGLYKYGLVMNYDGYTRRETQHKKESIDKVKEFTGKDMKVPNIINIYKKKTKIPKGDEETIKTILLNNINDINGTKMITMFENRGNKNDSREYFICHDIDYIIQTIIPLLSWL